MKPTYRKERSNKPEQLRFPFPRQGPVLFARLPEPGTEQARRLQKIFDGLKPKPEDNPGNASQMDPEAAIRRIVGHLKYVDRLRFVRKEINNYDERQSEREGGLIDAVSAIPKDCLDRQISESKTPRDLLNSLAKAATTDSLKQAIAKKLE